MKITLNIEKNKAKAFIEFIKSLDFIQIVDEEDYDPEFVKKINQSKNDIAEGRFTDVKIDELKEFFEG